MAFNLAALLQGAFGGANPQAPIQGEDISVTAQPNVRPPMEALLGNTQQLQASPTQVASQQPLEGLPQHKGMFGVKGTFRDILGLLGDSLSVGTGGSAIYQPKRQQERLSDAMVGFTDSNPLPAIQRIAAENPELAQKMHEKYLADVARQEKLTLDRETAEVDQKYRKAQIADKGRANISALFSAANAETFPRILEAARRAAATYDIDEDTLPTTLAEAKRWGLDPYKSTRLDQYDEGLVETKRHHTATIETSRANNANSVAASRANNANSVAASRENSRRDASVKSRGQDMTDKRIRESAGFNGKGRGKRDSVKPVPAAKSTPKSTSSSGGWGKMTVKN